MQWSEPIAVAGRLRHLAEGEGWSRTSLQLWGWRTCVLACREEPGLGWRYLEGGRRDLVWSEMWRDTRTTRRSMPTDDGILGKLAIWFIIDCPAVPNAMFLLPIRCLARQDHLEWLRAEARGDHPPTAGNSALGPNLGGCVSLLTGWRIKMESKRGSTYAILELDKGVGRHVEAYPIRVAGLNLETWKLASGPGVLNRDPSEANIIPVKERENAGERVPGFQPGPPAEGKGSATGTPVRVHQLTPE